MSTDKTATRKSKSTLSAKPEPSASLLYTGSDWNFDTLGRIFDAVRKIGEGELGLDDPWGVSEQSTDEPEV